MYISPEFQLGQVYDGTGELDQEIILYKPIYPCVPHTKTNSVASAKNDVVTNHQEDGNDGSPDSFAILETRPLASEPEKCTSV